MKTTKLNLLLAGIVLCAAVLTGCKHKPKKTDTPKAGSETQAASLTKSSANLDIRTTLKAKAMINNGVNYLLTAQDKDGGWSLRGAFKPALTALVLKCLVQHPDITTETPVVKKGFEVLLSFQQEDGGIYDPKQGRSNYCTSLAVCALAAANDPKYKANLDKAVGFLRDIQILEGTKSRDKKKPEGEVIGKDHPYVGGVSYGKHGRPDLNNLGWWMQAMHEAGVKGDDPAMQKALKFVSRCQNRTESNDLPWAKEKGTEDGGMIYAPAMRETKVPESKANPEGYDTNYISYGSMTYVGMKSMLYANVKKSDPRVKALYAWLRKNWTTDANPGMPKKRSQQSLYFYYNAMSKALRAYGEDEFTKVDTNDTKVNWRQELVAALAKRVKADGSWQNPEDRWNEGSPVLVTCYEILALQDIVKK